MTILSPPPARLVIYPFFEYGLGKLLVSPLRPYSTIGTKRRYDPENFQVRRVRDPKLETLLRAFHQGRVLPTRALDKRRDLEPVHRFRLAPYTPTANRISPFLPRDPRLPRLSGPRLSTIEYAAATLELNPKSHLLARLRGHRRTPRIRCNFPGTVPPTSSTLLATADVAHSRTDHSLCPAITSMYVRHSLA